jgi:DNA-binding response OmpR family regulator
MKSQSTPGLLAQQSGRPVWPSSTILVAEDNADGREMMEMLLRMKGYDVISAENGLQAVDIALQKLPDLILLDLELPQLDGLSVVRNLRRHASLKTVPMIILSGHDPCRYQEQALDAGCTVCLLKPVDFDELDKVMKSSIRCSGSLNVGFGSGEELRKLAENGT